MTPLMAATFKDMWFTLSHCSCNPFAELNAGVKTGRWEHLLNAYYVLGLC